MNAFRLKREPPTEINFAAVADNGPLSTEKPTAPELGGGVQRHQQHVDPGLEAQVIRKMDLRLVPLVMALCMLRHFSSYIRSLMIP
jgi:hypothetical protein